MHMHRILLLISWVRSDLLLHSMHDIIDITICSKIPWYNLVDNPIQTMLGFRPAQVCIKHGCTTDLGLHYTEPDV